MYILSTAHLNQGIFWSHPSTKHFFNNPQACPRKLKMGNCVLFGEQHHFRFATPLLFGVVLKMDPWTFMVANVREAFSYSEVTLCSSVTSQTNKCFAFGVIFVGRPLLGRKQWSWISSLYTICLTVESKLFRDGFLTYSSLIGTTYSSLLCLGQTMSDDQTLKDPCSLN